MRLSSIRNRYLLVLDAISLVAAAMLAFYIRFEEAGWHAPYTALLFWYVVTVSPVRLVMFHAASMYRRLWRHSGVAELRQIASVGCASGIVAAILGVVVLPAVHAIPRRIPISVVVIDSFLVLTAIALPRLLARTSYRTRRRAGISGKPVLIIGAGETAKLVVQELLGSGTLGLDPIGFVDDDPALHRHTLMALPILGPLTAIGEIVEKYSVAELILAMPSAHGSVVRRVVRAGLDSGIPTLTVPSLPEIISRRSKSTQLREVEIQDLLRREPVETDLAAVAGMAKGRTVLVTGAGGSIGSELCRQLARLAPSRLVLLGHGENSIFDIQNELKRAYPDIPLTPVIADVRDAQRIKRTLSQFSPFAVFHAAAHKHVPLMEENVPEAITNNVLGTRNIVEASVATDVEHFVLISTDKAVRPTSIMGASKRIAEQIVQHSAAMHDRNFVSVRFGNVLGSRGSVVPTFLSQIRAGGPVTITHPDMQRYFMTIPEAVQLVLQAGALGHGGEVFLLDMGEPIRIIDIARDLIRLSGLHLGTDIDIEFLGMRPGEKLYEEMFFSVETAIPTHHPKVLRARQGILVEGLSRRIDSLIEAVEAERADDDIRSLVQALVPDLQQQVPLPISLTKLHIETQVGFTQSAANLSNDLIASVDRSRE